MGRRPRVIRPAELAYYRSHFLEALGDDAVVCLECGTLLRDVKPHAWKLHGLTADQYRERWGYNRANPLIVPSLSAKLRQMAFDQNLPAKAPRHSFDFARTVRAQLHLPQRRERRLQHSHLMKVLVKAGKVPVFQKRVDDETLRSLAAENLSVRDIAARTGLTRGHVRQRLKAIGLFRPARGRVTAQELLALRRAGLWISQIAERTGLTVDNVNTRLQQMKRRGIPIPPPQGPRPNPRRRVSDEEMADCVRAGLRTSEIARLVGIDWGAVQDRVRALRRRGLLPPLAT